jgi:AcrR family transcriptional regulator
MRKGDATKNAIIDAGLAIAARDGLEGITIGSLAESIGMSKSGVFSHFGSREDLQIALLKAYEQRFIEHSLIANLKHARGLPRLQAIVDAWLELSAREATDGCIWISGATEYDARPGAVRETLVGMVHSWQREMSRAITQAVEMGHLRADTDAEQLVFEIYGVILVLHHDGRLLQSANVVGRAERSIRRLLESYQPLPGSTLKVDAGVDANSPQTTTI